MNLAQFFDEKTQELDAFGMVEYFHETAGPAARDALYNNIVAGITEGLQAAKLAGLFTEKSFGFFGDTLAENLASQLSGMLDADIVKLSEAQYSDALREDTKSLIQALEEGNLEMMNTLLTSNSDLFALFEEALADESQFDGFLSNFKNDAYKEIATNLNSAMQPIGTEIEQIEELNLVLGEQDVIVANIANSMADSIEGQQEMAELWNGMVEASSNVGEGGLFSIDADALGQSVEALEQVAYNMDEVQGRTEGTAEAFASLEEAQKEASEGAKAVGSAFDTMMESMGETDFERLIKLTGSTQDEIMSLAAQAKDGSIDAAKTLQNEMAKIYAAMNKDNEDYYRSFSKLNADKMNLIAKATGKQATDFKTLAEYEVHLESWKSDNVLKYVEWQHNTITDALSDQVENMGKAADTTMEYQGKQIDATGRSSAIATLMVARNAAVAAEQAGEGGGEAAANMIEAMGSVDEAAGVALNVVADNIRAKGDNFAGIIDYIDRQIAILQEGSEGTADDLKLDGITVPTFDEFKFNAKPGNIAPPTYTKPSGSNAPDDNGGGNDNGSGGGSGGKGGSDKGSGGEPETVEDIEEKLDVYKDVETALSEIAHLMAEQNDLERDLYGQAKIDSIQKRIKLMKEQAKWEQERIRISKAEQDKLRGTLSAQGVKFDSSSGLISNYNSFLQSEIDKVNAIADTNVDAKNAAIERYEALKEQMEEYETHLQAQKSAEEAYLEFQREISQSAIQAIDVKLQIELDKTELERQTEEFLMKVGDGLGSIMDKFLNTAEKVDTTIKLLYGSISDIGALQQKIADIENDPNLTDEDRLNQLKATKQEMIKFYETAMKYRQELEKMQQEAYKDAGKLVSEHLKEFEGINKELKSLLDIIKLTGQMNNTELVGSLMDTQINTTRNQLDAAIKSRDMFASKLANLEEGSEQWKIMNAEVQKLDEQILKLTNESIKLYQEQLKYTVDNVMKDLESALTNNNSFSKVDAALKKQNWEKKEYLSTTEKILSISKLQQKIEEEIQKTTDPAKQKQLQDFLENEVGLLKEKDKLTHYDMERAEKMLEITMKQIALDNARNNKTMMRLVRTSTGNWAYQYVADAEAVEQAQSDLSDSLADLLEFDQKRQEEVQKEMLEQKKAFYKQLEEIMKAALNGEYETQEEFNKAIEDAEKEFNMVMEDLNISLNTANQNLSESTLAAILDAYRNNHGEIGVLTKEQEEFFKNLADSTTDIWGTVRDFLDTVNSDNADSFKDKYADLVAGDADDLFNSLQDTFGDISSEWDNSVSDMITSNDNLTLDTNTAIESIKDAWSDYQDNLKSVTEQAGLDLDGMKDKIDQLGDEQDILAGKTDSLIGSIENELDALQDLAGDLDKVYDAYDKLMDKVDEYMRQLDDLIRKQQDAMNPVTPTTPTVKPPTTSGSTSGSTGGSTGGSSSGSGFSSSLTKGGKARVKSGRTWYHDTDGTNPSGPTTPYANRDLYIVNTTNKKYPYAVGSTTNISSALGWLRKEDLVGFDTGGYTGDWGHNDGKMAMLHEKELVLNKEDTSNILDIVKITREMAATSANLNNLGTLGRNSQGDIKQQVTINAEFPNVSAASEIEKAFANMGNQASQYALERGRIR